MAIQKYTDDQREKAVSLYIASGSETFVAKTLGVPRESIKQWRAAQWWKEELRKQLIERDFLLQNKFTFLIEKAAEIVLDRMEKGDVRILKDGTEKRTPIPARDAMMIAAIFHDKRRDARNTEVAAESAQNTNQLLQTLADKFASFGKQTSKKPEIIDVEVIKDAVESELQTQLQTGSESGVSSS